VLGSGMKGSMARPRKALPVSSPDTGGVHSFGAQTHPADGHSAGYHNDEGEGKRN